MTLEGITSLVGKAGQVVESAGAVAKEAKAVKNTVAPAKEESQSKPAAPAGSPAAQQTLEASTSPGSAKGEEGPSDTELTAAKMDAVRAEGSANSAATNAQKLGEAKAGCALGKDVCKAGSYIPVVGIAFKVGEVACAAGEMGTGIAKDQSVQKATAKKQEAEKANTEYNELATAAGKETREVDLEDPNEQGGLSKVNSAWSSIKGMAMGGMQAGKDMKGLFGKGEQAGGEAAAGQGGEAAAGGQSGGSGGFMGKLGGLFGGGGSGAAGGAAGSAAGGAAGDAAGSAAGSMAGGVAGGVASAAV